MTEEDKQFSRAWYDYFDSKGEDTPATAHHGRKMLAALEAHGCIEKPGLSVRQELVARMTCAALEGGGLQGKDIVVLADIVLALGDTK